MFLFDVAVGPQSREHHLRLPGLFQLGNVARALILAAFGIVAREDGPHVKEDKLRDTAADDDGDHVVLRGVRNFHHPAVGIAHVAPARTLADVDEIAAHGGARLHHGGDGAAAADELLRVREDGLARLKEDDFVVRADAVEGEVEVGERLLGCLRAARRGVPHRLRVLFAIDVEYLLVPGGALFAEVPLAERDVVATGGEVLTIERFDDDRARLHVLDDLFVRKRHSKPSYHPVSEESTSHLTSLFGYVYLSPYAT